MSFSWGIYSLHSMLVTVVWTVAARRNRHKIVTREEGTGWLVRLPSNVVAPPSYSLQSSAHAYELPVLANIPRILVCSHNELQPTVVGEVDGVNIPQIFGCSCNELKPTVVDGADGVIIPPTWLVFPPQCGSSQSHPFFVNKEIPGEKVEVFGVCEQVTFLLPYLSLVASYFNL